MENPARKAGNGRASNASESLSPGPAKSRRELLAARTYTGLVRGPPAVSGQLYGLLGPFALKWLAGRPDSMTSGLVAQFARGTRSYESRHVGVHASQWRGLRS